MGKITKLALIMVMCWPAFAAEPNLPAGASVRDPNVVKQRNLEKIERRRQRINQRKSAAKAGAAQQTMGGKEFAQQKLLKEKQFSDEYMKNRKRIAKLARIKELAMKTNQPQKAQKADSLILMENQRHRERLMEIQGMAVGKSKAADTAEPNIRSIRIEQEQK